MIRDWVADSAALLSIGVIVAQEQHPDTEVYDQQTVEFTFGIGPRPEMVDGDPLPDEWPRTDPNALSLGDCASWHLDEGLVLSPIPCDPPHRFQLLATVEFHGPEAFGLDADLEDKCDTIFHQVVGAPHARSRLEAFRIYPAEDWWASGDRAGNYLAFPGGRGTWLARYKGHCFENDRVKSMDIGRMIRKLEE